MEKKLKKIGLLTFHYSRYNFGAVLQTYSTYKSIERLGHIPHIVNYVPKVKTIKGKIWTIAMKFLGHGFDEFRKKYLPNILHKTQTQNELISLNNILDGFVVGSDQIWRYVDDHEKLCKYYLDFVDDDKLKISYAASFGVDFWPTNKIKITNHIKKLLKRFDSISVREQSGQKICKDIFEVGSLQVLDPTLLLSKKDFNDIANPKRLSKSKYIAYMLLDDTKEQETYLKKICKSNNLSFIRILGKKIHNKRMMYAFNSVGDWLSYVRDSELVITDSFHCLIFALIFQKNFAIVTNDRNGNTRLLNLLSLLKQENRIYNNLSNVPSAIISDKPDYSKIDIILNIERKKSLDFLKNSLQ